MESKQDVQCVSSKIVLVLSQAGIVPLTYAHRLKISDLTAFLQKLACENMIFKLACMLVPRFADIRA